MSRDEHTKVSDFGSVAAGFTSSKNVTNSLHHSQDNHLTHLQNVSLSYMNCNIEYLEYSKENQLWKGWHSYPSQRDLVWNSYYELSRVYFAIVSLYSNKKGMDMHNDQICLTA